MPRCYHTLTNSLITFIVYHYILKYFLVRILSLVYEQKRWNAENKSSIWFFRWSTCRAVQSRQNCVYDRWGTGLTNVRFVVTIVINNFESHDIYSTDFHLKCLKISSYNNKQMLLGDETKLKPCFNEDLCLSFVAEDIWVPRYKLQNSLLWDFLRNNTKISDEAHFESIFFIHIMCKRLNK